MRFHVLGIPHTASNKEYSSCAFTQKVVNMCKMLTMRGHDVFHYGNEVSRVDCSEHISVTDANAINPPDQSGKFDQNSDVYLKFLGNTIRELGLRKQPGDFLLLFWTALKPIADAHPDLIVVEAGIGYPYGHFAPYKVFESYAVMHAYRGMQSVATANGNSWWYDIVIPNYYDIDDFRFSTAKGQYLLFMGMRANGSEGKGDYIAAQVARKCGIKLIMAGSGVYYGDPEGCEIVGFVNGDRRKQLYANAIAVLAPSLFVEPFCGVQIESMFSGTPVVSTDWGAFAEYNIHGVTGFRCRTFAQFVNAVNNINLIKRRACRNWALANFSLDRVSRMYEEYWNMIVDSRSPKGWYSEHPDRLSLDWLHREYPHWLNKGYPTDD